MDCDGDAVLYVVRQTGPACHTGERSCFHTTQEITWPTSGSSRPSGRPSKPAATTRRAVESYTRKLLAAPAKARRKVVEEAYEVVEAQQGLLAGQDTAEHLALEAADLVYHLFVVLASAGVTPGQVYEVLERRHGAGQRPGSP